MCHAGMKGLSLLTTSRFNVWEGSKGLKGLLCLATLFRGGSLWDLTKIRCA